VEIDPDISDFGEVELPRIYTETGLRICDTVIPTPSFESRISWVLAGFDPPKECFEGQFHSQHNILKRQRMDFFVFWMLDL